MNAAEDTEFDDLLDVVNCAEHSDEIIEHAVYTCPVEGRPYKHRRCKYLGVYKDKTVAYVAFIDAVVDVYSENHAEVCWINGNKKSNNYIEIATEKAVSLRENELPRKVFLLSDVCSTNFIKDTKGGLFASKVYFDISSLHVNNTADLAKKLYGQTWSEHRNQIKNTLQN